MSKNAYQEALLDYWNITAQDLAMNERGKASYAQKEALKTSLRLRKRFVIAVLAFIFLALSVSIYRFSVGAPRFYPQTILGLFFHRLIFFLVPLPAVLFGFVTIADPESAETLPFKAFDGKVRIKTSHVRTHANQMEHEMVMEAYLDQGDDTVRLPIEDYQRRILFDGSSYTVYFLGADVVGVKSHDTPKDFNPKNFTRGENPYILMALKVVSAIIVIPFFVYLFYLL